MQFGISSQHIDFFQKNSYIEFEDLFPLTQIREAKEAIDTLLKTREKKMLETCSCNQLFLAGRELRKENALLEKIALHKKLAKTLSQLIQEKILRLAYDQMIVTKASGGILFPEPYSLQQVSCFQPIVGGVLLRLSDTGSPVDFLPRKAGNALFFTGTLPLPWSAITQEPEQSFLLLAYGPNRLLYVLEKHDPHTHIPKKQGYVFGDAVTNDTHPIVLMS